jgi:amino-acid N-acetyltransferase
MTEITYQFAQPNDRGRIIDLLESVALPTADLLQPVWQNFIVAHQAEQFVGVIGLETQVDFGLVRSLAVAESARGGGLGFELLHRIEAHAQAIDITELGLITDSAPEFFRRHGYRVVARPDAPPALRETKQFRCICPDAATIMLKSLS